LHVGSGCGSTLWGVSWRLSNRGNPTRGGRDSATKRFRRLSNPIRVFATDWRPLWARWGTQPVQPSRSVLLRQQDGRHPLGHGSVARALAPGPHIPPIVVETSKNPRIAALNGTELGGKPSRASSYTRTIRFHASKAAIL